MSDSEIVSLVQLGEEIQTKAKTLKVLPSCKWLHNGYWYCATHDITFITAYEKYTHIEKGNHQLGWLCWEHGLERP